MLCSIHRARLGLAPTGPQPVLRSPPCGGPVMMDLSRSAQDRLVGESALKPTKSGLKGQDIPIFSRTEPGLSGGWGTGMGLAPPVRGYEGLTRTSTRKKRGRSRQSPLPFCPACSFVSSASGAESSYPAEVTPSGRDPSSLLLSSCACSGVRSAKLLSRGALSFHEGERACRLLGLTYTGVHR